MAKKKRTKQQIIHDRARIAELTLQKYTQPEIIEMLRQETGLTLSQQQISYDIMKVKKDWLRTQHESYNFLMMQEFARIDALESEIWKALRDSVREKERHIVERARRKINQADDSEYELVITKTQDTLEQHSVSPAYFSEIHKQQQERRKLLGLYAPQQIGINKTVVIKGYKNVSPDDWDNVIEGELVS